ncbi:MAG: ABC transporter permease [Galactobacter sp.]
MTESISTSTPTLDGVRTKNAALLLERLILPIVWLALIVIFGVLRPNTFMSWSNIANVLGSQSVLFVLALAALLPVFVGDLDLSLGGIMGISAATVGVGNVVWGLPIWVSLVLGLVFAVLAGALNAFIVVTLDTNPLIVTLATGTVYTGIIYFLVNSTTVAGVDSQLSAATFTTRLLGVSLAFFFAGILMILLWIVTSWTRLGLRSRFVEQSHTVARLSGVNVSRVRWLAFVSSGLIAGLAGVFLVGLTGAVDPAASGSYLLPAYAAVFLGATTISPGRFNAIGTGIAVYFLATGVNGLQILGAQNYVQQLFYGGALVLAVVLSRWMQRRA